MASNDGHGASAAKDAGLADTEADKTDAGKGTETESAEEAELTALRNKLRRILEANLNGVEDAARNSLENLAAQTSAEASTDAVFKYFSTDSGVPAERLWNAMRILGINPKQDEADKHLVDLGRPKYIDHKMFHRFIEGHAVPTGQRAERLQDVLDYLKQFDKDRKGVLSEQELQELMRGSELSQEKVQACLRKLTRSGECHLDISKLIEYFLVRAEELIPRQDVASKVREALVQIAEAEARYSLKDPQALAQFLQEADLRLVRATYLVDLVHSRRPFPRRQETESELFICGDKTETALVTHAEVQNWASGGQRAIICSISHAWEAREHPDPCRYQLQHIVNHAGLYGAAFDADIWVYYDYVSLFQYQRLSSHEEQSFRKAMEHMHLLFAHECTLTFTIETLTPEHDRETMLDLVPVFELPSRSVKAMRLIDLVENLTPYSLRGWCIAETEWSLLRRVSAQRQQIDRQKSDKDESKGDIAEDGLNGRVPTAPHHFAQHFIPNFRFTHRSDAEAVIYLQRVIFHEKVTWCEHLVLEGLPACEILSLSHVLPYYEKLKSMKLKTFRCGEAEARAFGKALALSRVEKLEVHNNDPESSKFLVEAVSEALETNMSVSDINMEGNDISAQGAKALAKALKINCSVRDIKLGYNRILDEGAKVLAEVLKVNTSVRDIHLERNGIGIEGAKALAKALKINGSVRDIKLGYNRILDEGAKVLAEVLKVNTSVRDIHLERNGIGIEGAKALAEALKINCSVRDIKLGYNRILDEGAKALADALKTRDTDQTASDSEAEDRMGDQQISAVEPFEAPVRLKALADALKTNSLSGDIDLKGDSIGAKGAQALAEVLETNTSVRNLDLKFCRIGAEETKALAEALKVNSSVEVINMKRNDIGTEGAKALAEALKVNSSVEVINMEDNDIGTEGAKALAKALKVNTTVRIISMKHNDIGTEGAKALAEALIVNTFVSDINLANNGIGVEGAKALAEALIVTTSVSEINLANNGIGVAGAEALAEALISNTSVKNINLVNNGIVVEGAEVLEELLEEKKRMGFGLPIVF